MQLASFLHGQQLGVRIVIAGHPRGCPLLLVLLHGKEAEAPSFSLPHQLDSVEGP